MSLLTISDILRLFFNRLSADDQYSLPNSDNLQQPLKMKLFQKKKTFLNFLLYIWYLLEILNILKENMTLIAYVFPKLRTTKDVVR